MDGTRLDNMGSMDVPTLMRRLCHFGAMKLAVRKACKWRRGCMEESVLPLLREYNVQIDAINKEMDYRSKADADDRWRARQS